MTAQKPPPTPQVDPPWLTLARAEVGVKEKRGAHDNPRIIEYLKSTRLGPSHLHDETAWCSAFANWCMTSAGYRGTIRANARSWLEWGTPLEEPRMGCVVVLWRRKAGQTIEEAKRGSFGHVGFYVKNGGNSIWLLGGNQHNAVGMTPYPIARVLGFRWPRAEDRLR